jgi:hypothetical protein
MLTANIRLRHAAILVCLNFSFLLTYGQKSYGGELEEENDISNVVVDESELSVGGNVKYKPVDLAAGVLPPAGRQGNINSCQSYAVAYLKIIEQAKLYKSPKPPVPFSPTYLFQQLVATNYKGECTEIGYTLKETFAALSKVGISTITTTPIDNSPEHCGKISISPDARVEALKYKCSSNPTRLMNSSLTIVALKEALSNGNAVAVSSLFDTACTREGKKPEYRNKKFVWNKTCPCAILDYKNSTCVNKNKVALHALLIVGYDTSGFKILNSFGPDWGTNGFFWIPEGKIISFLDAAYFTDCSLDKPELAVGGAFKDSGGTANVKNERSLAADVISHFQTANIKIPAVSNFFKDTVISVIDPTLLTPMQIIVRGELVETNSASAWVKSGYYVDHDSVIISCVEVNKRADNVVFWIYKRPHENTYFSEIEPIQIIKLSQGSKKSFYYNNVKYLISLDEIANRGNNPFKKAAVYSIRTFAKL